MYLRRLRSLARGDRETQRGTHQKFSRRRRFCCRKAELAACAAAKLAAELGAADAGNVDRFTAGEKRPADPELFVPKTSKTRLFNFRTSQSTLPRPVFFGLAVRELLPLPRRGRSPGFLAGCAAGCAAISAAGAQLAVQLAAFPRCPHTNYMPLQIHRSVGSRSAFSSSVALAYVPVVFPDGQLVLPPSIC